MMKFSFFEGFKLFILNFWKNLEADSLFGMGGFLHIETFAYAFALGNLFELRHLENLLAQHNTTLCYEARIDANVTFF